MSPATPRVRVSLQLLALLLIVAAPQAHAAAGSCSYLAAPGASLPATERSCRDYSGSGWNGTNAAADCAALGGTYSGAQACAAGAVGTCTTDAGQANQIADQRGTLKDILWQPLCAGDWTSGAGIYGSQFVDINAETALNSTAFVTVNPEGCDDACVAGLVATNGAITFTPATTTPTRGVLILGEAYYNPRSYAFVASRIARQGFFAAIVPAANDFPLGDTARLTSVINAHPGITQWAIGGHGHGGIAAAMYAADDPDNLVGPADKVQGLFQWAGFVPAGYDLSASGLKGLSLVGNVDFAVDRPQYEAGRNLMPQKTYNQDVRNANHGNFADFGFTTANDGSPYVTNPTGQQNLAAGATSHLVRRLGVPDAEDVVAPAFDRLPWFSSTFCRDAQLTLAGMTFTQLGGGRTRSTLFTNLEDFVYSKSTVNSTFPGVMVEVAGYSAQEANADNIHLPPVIELDYGCKTKNQAMLVATYGLVPASPAASCRELNQQTMNQVLAAVDETTFMDFLLSGITLNFLADNTFGAGPGWVAAQVLVQKTATGNYNLRGPQIQTAPGATGSEPFDGVFYCKAIAPQRFLKLILDTVGYTP